MTLWDKYVIFSQALTQRNKGQKEYKVAIQLDSLKKAFFFTYLGNILTFDILNSFLENMGHQPVMVKLFYNSILDFYIEKQIYEKFLGTKKL